MPESDLVHDYGGNGNKASDWALVVLKDMSIGEDRRATLRIWIPCGPC